MITPITNSFFWPLLSNGCAYCRSTICDGDRYYKPLAIYEIELLHDDELKLNEDQIRIMVIDRYLEIQKRDKKTFINYCFPKCLTDAWSTHMEKNKKERLLLKEIGGCCRKLVCSPIKLKKKKVTPKIVTPNIKSEDTKPIKKDRFLD